MNKTILETKNFKRNLYTVGAVASVLQLVVIVAYSIVTAALGPRITSAEEFFAVQQSSRLAALVRLDFLLLVLIGLYLGNFPALLVALWREKPITTLFATLFTVIAVILSFASESTFALLRLGDLYAAAGSEALRAQFLAAGEAVIAAGWWNSSSSYVTGILLQGSGVIISLVMLRSKDFRKMTAIAGLVGNAVDLLQHLIHPFVTAVPAFFSILMVFYLIWYPMLAWDLFRLTKAQPKMEAEDAR